MRNPKTGASSKGQEMHYSVGAIIKKNEKYLLIERVKPPYGWAAPAGHIDEGEDKTEALYREIFEETGLELQSCQLKIEEEIDWNTCSKEVGTHYWYVFECEVYGKPRRNKESKNMEWYTAEEIKKLELEPIWKYWFEKLGII